MIMPWGEHKGEEICDLDDSYLRWLVDCCEDEEIQTEASEELSTRRDNSPGYGR